MHLVTVLSYRFHCSDKTPQPKATSEGKGLLRLTVPHHSTLRQGSSLQATAHAEAMEGGCLLPRSWLVHLPAQGWFCPH